MVVFLFFFQPIADIFLSYYFTFLIDDILQ